jgi:hypothetical protein
MSQTVTAVRPHEGRRRLFPLLVNAGVFAVAGAVALVAALGLAR